MLLRLTPAQECCINDHRNPERDDIQHENQSQQRLSYRKEQRNLWQIQSENNNDCALPATCIDLPETGGDEG